MNKVRHQFPFFVMSGLKLNTITSKTAGQTMRWDSPHITTPLLYGGRMLQQQHCLTLKQY